MRFLQDCLSVIVNSTEIYNDLVDKMERNEVVELLGQKWHIIRAGRGAPVGSLSGDYFTVDMVKSVPAE